MTTGLTLEFSVVVTVLFVFESVAGTVVCAGLVGVVVCRTEMFPVSAGIESIRAVSIKTIAAPIVIFDKTDCVPRGPKAVLEILLVKSAPASALPGCNKIVPTKTMQEIKNNAYKKITILLLFVIDNSGETFRFEACAADQRAVNVRLLHQLRNIFRFNRTAVKNSRCFRRFAAVRCA